MEHLRRSEEEQWREAVIELAINWGRVLPIGSTLQIGASKDAVIYTVTEHRWQGEVVMICHGGKRSHIPYAIERGQWSRIISIPEGYDQNRNHWTQFNWYYGSTVAETAQQQAEFYEGHERWQAYFQGAADAVNALVGLEIDGNYKINDMPASIRGIFREASATALAEIKAKGGF